MKDKKLAVQLQIDKLKEQRRMSIELTEKYQQQNSELQTEINNLENQLKFYIIEPAEYKKGDIVVYDDNRIAVITEIPNKKYIGYKLKNSNGSFVCIPERIKRLATLQDLRSEVGMMFKKCRQWSWQGTILYNYPQLFVNANYNDFLHFIINAKPIIEDKLEKEKFNEVNDYDRKNIQVSFKVIC